MDDDIKPIGVKVDTTQVERAINKLDELANRGDKVEKSLGDVGAASTKTGKSIDSLGKETDDTGRSFDGMSKDARKLIDDLNKSVQAIDKTKSELLEMRAAQLGVSQQAAPMIQKLREAEAAASGVGGAAGIAKTALLGFVGAFGIQQVVQLIKGFLNTADAVTNLNTQLAIATGSTREAAKVYGDLFQIAQRSRVEFVELGKTYAQISRASQDFGLSTRDTLRVTETLAKAITISGVSASSASAALVQLSQGLASGTLRGEELNSIMENTPRIARALADGLGVGIGKLREMGKEGELTGEKVAAALLKASQSVDAEFGKATLTVGQSMTVLENASVDLAGRLDKLTTASGSTATNILALAKALGAVADIVDRMNQQKLPAILLPKFDPQQLGFGLGGPALNAVNAIAARLLETERERDARIADEQARDNASFDAITERRAKEAEAAYKAAVKANEAVDKFVNAKNNMTKAEQKLADQRELLTSFANAVKGFANDSTQYLNAYKGLQQGLKKIDDDYKDKGAAKDAEQEAKRLNDAMAAGLGVRNDYVQQLETIQKLRKEGRIDEEMQIRFLHDLINEQPKVIEQKKAEEDIKKKLAKVDEDYLKTRAASIEADTKADKSLDARLKKLKQEQEEVGKSAEAVLMLAAARDIEADVNEIQRLQAALEDPRYEADAAALQRRIDKLREIVRVRTDIAHAKIAEGNEDAMVKAAADAAKAWQEAADDIYRAVTDSIFRSAEAGKDIFESLRDAVRGMFNNMVLRPIIQAGVGVVGGILGLPGAASAATASNPVIGNIGGLFSGASSLFGGLGGGGTLTGLYGAFQTGLTTSADLIPAIAAYGEAGLGGIGSALGLGSQLGAFLGPSGAAALSAAMTAVPYIAAAYAIYSLFKKDRGGPKAGGQSITDLVGGVAMPSLLQDATVAGGGRLLFTPDTADADIDKMTSSVIDAVKAMTLKLGGTLNDFTVGLGFDVDAQGTASNRLSSFLRVGGKDIYSQTDLDLGRDEAALKQALATEVVKLTVAGLQASDLPDRIASLFESIDLETATEEQLNTALQTAQAYVGLAEALDLLNLTLDHFTDAAIEAAGGAAAATQTVATYYKVTRTAGQELEVTTRLTTEAFDKLGYALPTSIEAFRDLVEKNPVVAANSELRLSLMALAPALELIYGPLEELNDVSKRTADSVRKAVDALELERAGVQEEMDGLIASFGDLSQTLAELETPAETVAGTFLRLGREINTMNDAMQRILGTADKTKLEQLSDAVATRNAIAGARGSVQEQITAAQLRGFVNRNDLAGGVALLQGIEDGLWGQLETTLDPAGVAAKLTNVIAQRYDMEARLAEQARDTRQRALEEEVTRLEELKNIAEGLNDTLLDLRTGSLSALAPREQLAVSKTDFSSVLAAAQGGDIEALRKLGSSGTQFLTEAQSFYASGGDYASIFGDVTGSLEAVGLSLADVPTQLSVAQDSLKSMNMVVDNTGAMVTDLQTLDTTLGTISASNETTIYDLTMDIRKLIVDMIEDRTELQAEFNANRERWIALDGHMKTIDANIQALRTNSDLAATA